MIKNVWIGLILLVLGVGVYLISFSGVQNNQQPTITEESSMDSDQQVMADEVMIDTSTQMMDGSKGSYLPFSPEVFSTAQGRRVLFFYASWCPTCKPVDQKLSENISKIPADVTVLRVNYNDPDTDQAEKELAQKYGVTYQHTFVQVDAQGNEVTKWNGGSLDELLQNIK